jgi:hypothetical protein
VSLRKGISYLKDGESMHELVLAPNSELRFVTRQQGNGKFICKRKGGVLWYAAWLEGFCTERPGRIAIRRRTAGHPGDLRSQRSCSTLPPSVLLVRRVSAASKPSVTCIRPFALGCL